MFKLPFFFVLFIVGLSFHSCDSEDRKVVRAFYYWKTNLEISENEYDYIEDLSIEKLYVKYFDVDWDDNSKIPTPLAQLEVADSLHFIQEVIPTVFITNRTLVNIKTGQLEDLSNRMISKIFELHEPLENQFKVAEIQLDCDWTKKTKAKYFELIEQMQKDSRLSNVEITATIRLHQVKYFEQTGIPPISRGMLMYYNMGELTSIETTNSILDNDIGFLYLDTYSKYPLKLDIALPLFSWGVLFRNNRFSKLINNLSEMELNDTFTFKQVEQNRFMVDQSTYLNGHYLYEGDEIRLEKSELQDITYAAKALSSINNEDPLNVSMYHLDPNTLKNYTHGNLQNVFKQLEKK